MAKEKFDIVKIVNSDGSFDLQFRKDTRHERTGSPTYYRWKAQFIITASSDKESFLKKVKKALGCGEVSVSKDQARFSVQKISDIAEILVPFFRKNILTGEKKKEFGLWVKAVEIIEKNKGKNLSDWKKNEVCSLIEIHKSSAKYKSNPRQPKWLDMAKVFTKGK